MPKTEAFTPPTEATQHTEATFGRERLTHEQLRQEFAKIALLAILIAEFSRKDRDFLFTPEEPTAETSHEHEPRDTSSEIFGLINFALGPGKRREQAKSKPGYHSFADSPFANAHVMDDFRAYRERVFTPTTSAPEPEFRPAPSMSETPAGPELPRLAFNDRIRPTSPQPTDAAFAAADRANEMYQRALFKSGWQGGEATSDQQKAARRDVSREYHPDRNPDQSAGDAEAFKAFNQGMDAQRAAAKAAESPSSGPSGHAGE